MLQTGEIKIKFHNCHLHGTQNKYRTICLTENNARVYVKEHQLIFFLNLNNPTSRSRPMSELKKLEISHICHRKNCVNIEHLSQEPHAINMARKTCKQNKKCIGHGVLKDCII